MSREPSINDDEWTSAKMGSPLQDALESPHLEKIKRNKMEFNFYQRPSRFSGHQRRSHLDRPITDSMWNLRKHFDGVAYELGEKYPLHDEDDILETHPSYQKFRVPFEIISRHRYSHNKSKYEEQFRREIKMLINYQPTALEASYLVRIISYTTFWPPLHNQHELDFTSKNFFQLSPKEKKRFDFIMSHEF